MKKKNGLSTNEMLDYIALDVAKLEVQEKAASNPSKRAEIKKRKETRKKTLEGLRQRFVNKREQAIIKEVKE